MNVSLRELSPSFHLLSFHCISIHRSCSSFDLRDSRFELQLSLFRVRFIVFLFISSFLELVRSISRWFLFVMAPPSSSQNLPSNPADPSPITDTMRIPTTLTVLITLGWNWSQIVSHLVRIFIPGGDLFRLLSMFVTNSALLMVRFENPLVLAVIQVLGQDATIWWLLGS